MRSPRRAFGWILAALRRGLAGAVVLAASVVAAEPAFFQEHPVLQFIEQRLPAGATVAIPPGIEPARRVATDVELRAAFAGVLDEFLAPPSTSAGKAGDLIGEVCRYRPAQTAQWLAVATDSLLEYSLPSAEKEISEAVAAAILASPRDAGSVMRAVIGRLAANIQAARLDRETAARIVRKIVVTAVQTARTLNPAPPLISDITGQALDEALTRDANDLAVAAMTAAVQGIAGFEGIRVTDLTKLVITKSGRTKPQVALVCLGALAGAGPEAATAIKDEAALRLPVLFSSYANIACNAYLAMSGAPDEAAFKTARFISVVRADYIPAVIIGAIVANPSVAAEILRAGLNRDLVLRGRATTRDIVEAAVLACPASAAQFAVAAVGHGDLQEGKAAALIAEGVVRGAPVAGIAAALAAQIATQDKDADTIKATVAGAIAGAVATGKPQALSTIAAAAAADPALAGEVLDQAIVAAPPESQYCAVLGVLATRPEQASALLARALKHADLARSQVAPITAAGRVILAIQAAPAGFFRATVQELREAAPASPEMVDAIVLGASLANPRGAPAVAAVAFAGSGFSAENLVATAAQSDPAALVRIEEAMGSAIEVSASPGRLFHSVLGQIAAAPESAPDVVTGALAAAPAQGAVIGHAAARSAPGALARIVPRLFAFSANDAAVENFVALTGGVIHGVLAAGLDPAAESAAIADAVAASVRSAVALTRGRSATPTEAEALAAVVAAATRAAPGHTVVVAQVAARTARALSCPPADLAGIQKAVLSAAARPDATKIAAAVTAGIAEADLQTPAASAKPLLDYAHDSLTGVPMTHFRDL